jgi:hypothetical protein
MNAEIVWYLQTVHSLSEEYSTAKGICGILRRLTSGSPEAALRQALWIASTAETAAIFLQAVLDSDAHASPVSTLQSRGYFLKGHPDFFKHMEAKLDQQALQHFIECLMWVYLDHKRPIQALKAVIGQTKVNSASDAESLLCVWINAVVKRYLTLPTVSSISRHFLGFPHFRVVLFNFVKDPELLNIATDHASNARVGLQKAIELHLAPPFSASDYQQPPLLLMCWLYSVIAGLSDVKPPQAPRPISREDIRVMVGSVEVAKKELAIVTAKVASLNESIEQITTRLSNMKRPRSAVAVPPPDTDVQEVPAEPRPESALGQSLETRRVTWQLPTAGEEQQQPPDEPIQEEAVS